jgi:hypothetical protein
MQIQILKADGILEDYLNTKIIGTINYALDLIDQPNILVAEQFAEVITYHLYEKQNMTVKSEEIHLLIESVLTGTGYDNAAIALNQHRNMRHLQRRRIEVINNGDHSMWSKSKIANDLMAREGLSRQIARAVASSVEQKVLALAMNKLPVEIVRHLIQVDTKAILKAEQMLAVPA